MLLRSECKFSGYGFANHLQVDKVSYDSPYLVRLSKSRASQPDVCVEVPEQRTRVPVRHKCPRASLPEDVNEYTAQEASMIMPTLKQSRCRLARADIRFPLIRLASGFGIEGDDAIEPALPDRSV